MRAAKLKRVVKVHCPMLITAVAEVLSEVGAFKSYSAAVWKASFVCSCVQKTFDYSKLGLGSGM